MSFALWLREGTFTVEFKRAARAQDINDREIVEAVVCLANGRGGHLVLGVEDDGRVPGVRPRHGDDTKPHLLSALILNKTDPPLACRASLHTLDGLDVAVVEVPDSPLPVGTTEGVFKRRSTKSDGTPECVPYRAHELQSAAFLAMGRDYAEVEARDVTLDDLDPREFERFRLLAAGIDGDSVLSGSSDRQILRALRLLGLCPTGEEFVALGAVLLFGTPGTLARSVPNAEVLFQEVNARGEIVTNDTLRMPLLRAIDELQARVAARNPEQELMLGIHRIGIPRVPLSVVREAIANALVHRSYAEPGPVLVKLGSEDFTVSSPGGLPAGVTLENLLDQSRPRSVVLAEAFKRAGLVDRAGRGIPQMFGSLLRGGRGEPDYSHTTDASVTVRIPTSDADLDMVRFIVSWEEENAQYLALSELRILHELKSGGPASAKDLQNDLDLPSSQVRSQCTRLIELGLIESHGQGRTRLFHLSSAFYRAAEDRNAYIRVRRGDPIHREQMVLAYIKEYGSITRGQVMKLVMIDAGEARSVLRRLVDSGAIELRGQRRGAHYILAGPGG
ncbi:MAG: RNA-binding domain-containing protein [Micropruina sp.]